jgi:cytochrome P450 family 6
MISLKNGGALNEEGLVSDSLTLEEIVAQTFVFFIAAFETTSSTMVLCLYELTKNQQLQRTVQEEIDRVLKGVPVEEISFDMLSQLKFLDCCILETLRKYPPAPFLIRECTKAYTLPGENITIPLGTPLIISTFGLHRDSDIYEKPNEFYPARFLTAKAEKPRGAYYPFGEGPRICIGMRMGNIFNYSHFISFTK